MAHTFGRSGRGDPAALRQAIDRFVESAIEPALIEPGSDLIAIQKHNFTISEQGSAVMLQAWDDSRNLVRRVTAIAAESRGRLELRFERFGKKTGTLTLVDLRRRVNGEMEVRAGRLEFREHFRRFLRRQFPTHRIVELSTEANLEASLSPAYARAFLREGSSAWAAIGAGRNCLHVDGALSFGLIWLDYLRRREPGLSIRGLVILLPAGAERTTCLRLRHLNHELAGYRAFAYTAEGIESPLDLRDYGNLRTQLETVHTRQRSAVDHWVGQLAENPAVETITRTDGELSLRVRGLQFARTAGQTLLYGLETNRVAAASNLPEIERFADELSRLRSAESDDKLNPLYLRGREAWLESQVRANMEQIDARLSPSPVYGQTTTVAGVERGLVDLLAADRDGRLAILELKASQDIHLPLQALDYWIHVKWHLDRNEFERAGYFPGVRLRREPPRMMLIAPALDFHPSNEQVLRFFSPEIEVQRVGVSADWQRAPKVMFRM